ncbi:MAG TPA: peptidylprolyl isomerase [Bryobacteraceae bacterium]|nr:peptidylprolyl isomerase [Bryobacteraceae bacterium]
MKFCGLLLMVCAGLALGADIGVVDEIIAKVNGDIITRGDLEHSRKQLEAELHQQGLSGSRLADALRDQEQNMLRDKIDQLLLVQKGKELNINVDSDVSKYLADMQRQFNIADPDKFQQFIHDQTGLPFEDYKNDIKNGYLTQRVIRQEVGSKITIKKEEIAKYYNEHKSEFNRQEKVILSEIFLSTEGKDAAAAAAIEKKAKDLVARARKGEKFGELARANSDGASAQAYGDIGGWEKGKLQPILEKAVWDKPRGYVTDPVRMPNGLEILKVEEHQKAGQETLEEAEQEITEKLFAPRMQPEVRAYLTKLRQDAFLQLKPGYVDSGAAPGKDTRWQDPAQLKPETVTKEEVSAKTRHKRLLWMIPIPGTETTAKQKTSSSH